MFPIVRLQNHPIADILKGALPDTIEKIKEWDSHYYMSKPVDDQYWTYMNAGLEIDLIQTKLPYPHFIISYFYCEIQERIKKYPMQSYFHSIFLAPENIYILDSKVKNLYDIAFMIFLNKFFDNCKQNITDRKHNYVYYQELIFVKPCCNFILVDDKFLNFIELIYRYLCPHMEHHMKCFMVNGDNLYVTKTDNHILFFTKNNDDKDWGETFYPDDNTFKDKKRCIYLLSVNKINGDISNLVLKNINSRSNESLQIKNVITTFTEEELKEFNQENS